MREPIVTEMQVELPDESATARLGAALAAALCPGLVVWLEGDLGVGKTALTRSVLRALGWQGPVKSPTYTLVELYAISRLNFHHFDFYRFADPQEFHDAGFGDYFGNGSVCFVEWPDKAQGFLPHADLRIALEMASGVAAEGRRARVVAAGERGRQCLKVLRAHLAA